MRRSRFGLGAVLAATAVGVWAICVPAAVAHGGEGVLEPLSVEPSQGSVEVSVRLTFASDGHAAEGATVTVAGEDAAGVTFTPVVLEDRGQGIYGATVELDGKGPWELRVTSVTPPAQLRVPVPESAAPATEASGGPPDLGDGQDADQAGRDETVTQGNDAGGSDGGPDAWVWVLGGVASVAAVAVGLIFVVRGRRQGPID